ncbi:MAG: type IV pilin N-terminal domain-containing protein, partial [Methanohalophilus sp.]
MIKRLRDFARKDDAVIEVFSEILLTGIIVLAIAAAAAFVLSSLDGPDNVRVDIDHWADSDSDTLYFRHDGGETVDVEDLELMVYVNGSYEKLTSSQFNYDDDEWALGDVIEVNTSSQFNYDITDDTRVPTKLVHTASSLVIYDAYGSMGDSGADGDDGG